MYKTFFNTVILAVLFLVNLSLITWFIDYLGQSRNAANDLQALEAMMAAGHSVSASRRGATLAIPNVTAAADATVVTPPQGPLQQRIVLEFGTNNSQLTAQQQQKLEELLSASHLSPLHQVKVIAGPTSDKNKALSPQMAKLRAQIIGRTIYSHTQSLSMSYQPDLKPGTVVVEISLVPR
ncbi:hypothetical protein [Thioflexithrix psekupsensis]|uniref:Uncharacterized protein n=1 Tax=Thioflexithrix psekupsensis TaxID=1570016 RepID=A0A251X7J3_9GAMM|nr:hypothetical protein [Thioflexithrix psekupsensis]OUD13159.1 hypothetical protein TPSD3_10990 [Thioflexithrix psekupsensis]